MHLTPILDRVHDAVTEQLGTGSASAAIPALAGVDTSHFGMAVATADGELARIGDADRPFSIQSVAKLFTTALVLARDGDALWTRVGREPSSHRYDALGLLDDTRGIPRNPFVNAGALVLVDRLLDLYPDGSDAVLDFIRTESGDPDIAIDARVAASERAASHRNAAAAHLIAAHGNLRNPIETVLDHYVAQSAIAASCADLARAAMFLATGTLRDGGRLLTPSATKRLNAVLLTCGTYDAAGDVAYRVGLPAKSGIGGGMLAIIPGRGVGCAWSPGLDASGNPIAATAALDAFTTATGWSIF
ncbi:glutaminase [Spirillospora sp. CA-294931]|uniref:glutaminase n=1 Tax=Spirillospora sp. CA-294931 TaxID=3240042 RepID=UPI003D943560